MASKWEISTDGKVYTFHLMDNVPWARWDATKGEVVKVQSCPDADGKTSDRMVTAQDFQYAMIRALEPATASPYAYVLAFAIEGADLYNAGTITDSTKVGVRVVDTTTLEVTFKEPAVYNANIIGLWTAHAVPKWLIEGDDCTEARGERWTETGFFQGYGPFVLKEWIHDASATFVKNPFWPGTADIPQPKLDEIQETFLAPAAQLAEYEAGNLDIVKEIPLTDIDRVKTDPTLSPEFKIGAQLSTYYYGFNIKAPIVDDVRVRRALSLAIDRQALIDNVTKGEQLPAGWFCRPGLAGCPDPKDFPDLGVKYDPAKAKQILDEYLTEKNTTADKLDLTLMFNSGSSHQPIAEAIQQMWRDNLGLDVKIVPQEWKVYLKTTKDPVNTPQIFRMGWVLDYPRRQQLRSRSGGVRWLAEPERRWRVQLEERQVRGIGGQGRRRDGCRKARPDVRGCRTDLGLGRRCDGAHLLVYAPLADQALRIAYVLEVQRRALRVLGPDAGPIG